MYVSVWSAVILSGLARLRVERKLRVGCLSRLTLNGVSVGAKMVKYDGKLTDLHLGYSFVRADEIVRNALYEVDEIPIHKCIPHEKTVTSEGLQCHNATLCFGVASMGIQ
ncbi:hypothetical protein B0H19DRAFT_659944 [Mycena capillaripes]|nr:hypothetical protein B0H19DRAFT_659944 [Mycena capillaripes]